MTLAQRALLSFVSWYSRHVPVEKGKGPLQQWALRSVSPAELLARTPEGDQYVLQFPGDHGWEDLYFRGRFETGTTQAISKLLSPTDVVLDIGANLGWFTIQMARGVPQGACHAFEPQPALFERLRQNCELNRLACKLSLNPIALGDHQGTAELHLFKGLGSGHSSLSTLGRTDYSTFTVPLIRLDDYLAGQGVSQVDLVKMDVEGAEKSVFAGAAKLLASVRPPIWVLEMNAETSKAFGYAPEDLLKVLEAHSPHRFLRVEHGWGKLIPMRSTSEYDHGDNVICVPAARADRLVRLGAG